MADGSITFSTALDNDQLEADLKRTEREIGRLKAQLERSEGGANAIAEKMEEADRAIEATRERLRELRDQLASVGTDDPALASSLQASIAGTTAVLREQEASQDRLYRQWEKLDSQADVYRRQLEASTTKAGELGDRLASASSGGAQAMERSLQNIEARMTRTINRVGKMVARVFVFNAILSVLRSVRDMIASALADNERYAASFAYVKATATGFSSAIANAVAPAIIAAMNVVASVLMTVASLIDRVFGTSIVAAINQARSSAKAAAAIGDQAKATKKLANEQKKAAKTLLGFDEINQMQADTADDAAGSLGDSGGAGGAGPDWDALDVGMIDAKLAEIMLILGASLLAVGAVLAFSGINIPVGLTLMAIGALMIYTAYREQWDALPGKVRAAITGALVLTGIVLLVLGAVLAFSGANIPLGVGLMVAGAAMEWAAVGLNWKSMSSSVRLAVSALMGILSGALLAVGALMALAGVSIPLGIALMAVGSASLATVVALNWSEMPDAIQVVVTTIMGILSGALLALGAILAISGVNMPLGLGLMVAGAIGLAASVALNWSTLKDGVTGVLTAIASAVGGALLVVGAVLAFSGANLPLGIGLLVAGALALASVATLNWDEIPSTVSNVVSQVVGLLSSALMVVGAVLLFSGVNAPLGLALLAAGFAGFASAGVGLNWNYVKDKVKEAWEAVVDYWQRNIAPKLTFSYWAGLLKNAMNGLISSLNAGLSGFGWFLSSIMSGVSGILGAFGVSWSGWVSLPSIPYLAQGAVIPPNREFLAVLGDQTTGTNIETPESLMRQVVREEAGSMIADAVAALMASGQGGGRREIVLQVGRRELARAAIEGARDLSDSGEVTFSDGFAFA